MFNPGQIICRKAIFGEFHRYAVAPVWTRFNTVQWFVWDAHIPDRENNGKASLIRQSDSLAEALTGFEKDVEFFFENYQS